MFLGEGGYFNLDTGSAGSGSTGSQSWGEFGQGLIKDLVAGTAQAYIAKSAAKGANKSQTDAAKQQAAQALFDKLNADKARKKAAAVVDTAPAITYTTNTGTNRMAWIAGGVGLVVLVGGAVYFATKRKQVRRK